MSDNDFSDNDDKVKIVLQEIDKTKQSVEQGISRAIDRGDNLEELDEKAAMLTDDARQFNRKSRSVRRHFCLEQWKIILFIILIIGIIVLVLWLSIAPPQKNK